MESARDPARGAPLDVGAITRPDSALLTYYLLASLLAGPFFVFPLIPLVFKYQTLRYKFDAEGISMSWGLLFKREIVLTYRRIQDIHVKRNLIQRWLRLATVSIQTASGSSSPEISIEGVLRADELRDYLYSQMRGARGRAAVATADSGGKSTEDVPSLLREIRDLLKAAAQRSARAGK
jgi:uncharacterized protein